MTEVLKKIFPWTIFSIGVVLTVRDQLIPPFILLAFVASIPSWKKIEFRKELITPILFISLYLLYLIGLTYSDNMKYGVSNIETKMSFFIFPMMLLFTYKSWDHKLIQLAKNGIIIGVGISLLITYGRAIFCYLNGGDICFRADQFGFNMHATYLSLIYVVSLIFLFEKKSRGKELILKITYALVVLSAVYLMRSLSTMLFTAGFFGLAFIYKAVQRKKYWRLILIPVLGILGSVTLKQLPQLNYDFEKTIRIMNEYRSDRNQFLLDNNNHTESNTVRLIVWDFSTIVINNNPFGVGTGDAKDELYKEYRKNSFWYYADKELNPHCQFLETGVALGWIGIIILTLLVLSPLAFISTWKNLSYLGFVMAIFVSCLFESYLERQVGVIFFSFISCVFVAQEIQRKLEIK